MNFLREEALDFRKSSISAKDSSYKDQEPVIVSQSCGQDHLSHAFLLLLLKHSLGHHYHIKRHIQRLSLYRIHYTLQHQKKRHQSDNPVF